MNSKNYCQLLQDTFFQIVQQTEAELTELIYVQILFLKEFNVIFSLWNILWLKLTTEDCDNATSNQKSKRRRSW